MRTDAIIREAAPDDAPACAAIFNDWVDATDWMPRVHNADDVEKFYRGHLFKTCTVLVGETSDVCGFLALDEATASVDAFYLAPHARRAGLGEMLLTAAKDKSNGTLSLWTFVANTDAQRFYEREGFAEVKRTDGENEEALPDIFYRWAT